MSRLRKVRERYQWSQQEVAEALGVNPLTVSRWERGKSSPSPRHQRLLCRLFRVSPEVLGWHIPSLEASPTQSRAKIIIRLVIAGYRLVPVSS